MKDEAGNTLAKGNLRIWTKYFDSISGINDFKKELDLVMNLGMGSLPQEHVITFASFINSGLDKLPTPKELFTKDVEWSLKELKENIKSGKEKRQDIAGIISKRLLNYAITNESDFTKKMSQNYIEMLESGFLSADICVLSVKKLVSKVKFKDFILRPKLLDILNGK